MQPGLLIGRRGALGVAAALTIAGAGAPGASAQGTQEPPVTAARLQGDFQLAGHVMVAKNVRGEHTGENVTRFWTFKPLCPSGPCQTVVLIRHRRAGTDIVTLDQTSPGHYSGQGSFTAPLRCDGRRYPRGALIPFAITVDIDSATVTGDGQVIAGRVSSTYINTTRINRTPCFAVLGHDTVRYHGHILLPPAT